MPTSIFSEKNIIRAVRVARQNRVSIIKGQSQPDGKDNTMGASDSSIKTRIHSRTRSLVRCLDKRSG